MFIDNTPETVTPVKTKQTKKKTRGSPYKRILTVNPVTETKPHKTLTPIQYRTRSSHKSKSPRQVHKKKEKNAAAMQVEDNFYPPDLSFFEHTSYLAPSVTSMAPSQEFVMLKEISNNLTTKIDQMQQQI